MYLKYNRQSRIHERLQCVVVFFFSSRRRHTRFKCDWSSDVCSSDLGGKIDPLNAFGAAINTREHLAQRCCGRVRIDGSSRDIRQKRMKYHVVLSVEQEDLAL